MWIFTKEGFFSVVSKDNFNEEIWVKTRCKTDLINLCNKLDINSEKIIEDFSGYPYQIALKKQLWISYLTDYVYEIDYDTVQDNIILEKDNERKEAYKAVWETMYNWMGMASSATLNNI